MVGTAIPKTGEHNETWKSHYMHNYEFWACMDTVRDNVMLEKLWASGSAPWKVWS